MCGRMMLLGTSYRCTSEEVWLQPFSTQYTFRTASEIDCIYFHIRNIILSWRLDSQVDSGKLSSVELMLISLTLALCHTLLILHCVFLCMESTLCVTINKTHRDTGMTTITHHNKVVNNVTIEINNKSMVTHTNIWDFSTIILQFSFKFLTIPSLIVSCANILSKLSGL